MVTLTYQERFKTAKGVFDEHTERNIFELQSRGVFDELVSPYKIGKESNVFIAAKDDKKLIVKIYRVQNCDFKRMYHYIRKDPRYSFLKHHRRQIIFSWTQREFRNLKYAEKARRKVMNCGIDDFGVIKSKFLPLYLSKNGASEDPLKALPFFSSDIFVTVKTEEKNAA